MHTDSAFQRWPDQPNDWPTGIVRRRYRFGIIGMIFRIFERGEVGSYAYRSGSTYVPIHWERGETTWHHISEFSPNSGGVSRPDER